MRRPGANYYRLLYAGAAMGSSPQDRSEIAAILGVDKIFEQAQPPKRSFVYLLDTHEHDNTRYFKVGRSTQPHIRLRQIQSGTGVAMPPGWEKSSRVQPHAIREGGPATEQAIHCDLAIHRVPRTEWFLGNMAVAAYIVGQDAWDSWGGEPIPDDYDFSLSIPA